MTMIAGLPWVGLLAAMTVVGCSNEAAIGPNAGAPPALMTFQAVRAADEVPVLDVTSSVKGTDANRNGVRDDLDRYIAGLPDTPAQKRALTQLARALQTTLSVNTQSATATATAAQAVFRGDSCVWQRYNSGQSSKAQTMEDFTMNTRPRLVAYEKYNAARNGTVVSPPAGSVCN